MIAYLGYQFLYTGTTIWLLEVMLFVQGIGMANVMAPATESIMSTLPREQAGAGSAVNNTLRQVGGALGVAVLGSLLSSTYRAKVTPTLDTMALPKPARDAAGESIGALYQIIGKGGRPTGPQWQQGQQAFIHAMHWTSAGSALVVFIGMVVALKWLPGKTSGAQQGQPAGVTEQVHV
jgi:MFS transporter, DHA2 family, multidrug resistance protein